MRAIDLFCGGGGSSWGAKSAGAALIGAVDAWDIATATYSDNFPTARRNVVTARLTDRTGPEVFDGIGKVDLLMASPECTNHSIAKGNKPRCEESRRSGWYIRRFVEELAPRWIVLENVPLMRFWSGYDQLLTALQHRYGYHLRIQTLDAADFGVPQNRKRLFIVGDRKRLPVELTPRGYAKTVAQDILDSVDQWPAAPVFNGRRAKATLERVQRGIDALGRGRDFLIVYYGSDAAGGWQPLDRPIRTLTTLDRFGLVRWAGRTPTLRMLQVPELARAMGVAPLHGEHGPAMQLLRGTRRDKIRVLGNGVCAPVMAAIVDGLDHLRATRVAAAALKTPAPRSRRIAR